MKELNETSGRRAHGISLWKVDRNGQWAAPAASSEATALAVAYKNPCN